VPWESGVLDALGVPLGLGAAVGVGVELDVGVGEGNGLGLGDGSFVGLAVRTSSDVVAGAGTAVWSGAPLMTVQLAWATEPAAYPARRPFTVKVTLPRASPTRPATAEPANFAWNCAASFRRPKPVSATHSLR